jgi:serine phosphatase RsbU (regulator of sigma subunit)
MSHGEDFIDERELRLAAQVQRGFQPDRPPEIPGYEFFDFYQPTSPTGGDYFDYIPLSADRLALVVADVVARGVAAALLMAKLSAETRFALFSEPTPAAAVVGLNQRLCESNMQRLVTMVLLVLDSASHRATLVNAGHMPPLHRRLDGRIEEPGATLVGRPLGVTDGVGYEQCEIEIRPGDSLTLFTNGISASRNGSGAYYTNHRLREQVRQTGGTPAQLGLALAEEVRRFVANAPQDDDMCLVCFGRLTARR